MHGFLVRVTKEKPKLETHLIEFDEDICVQFYAGTLRLHEGEDKASVMINLTLDPKQNKIGMEMMTLEPTTMDIEFAIIVGRTINSRRIKGVTFSSAFLEKERSPEPTHEKFETSSEMFIKHNYMNLLVEHSHGASGGGHLSLLLGRDCTISDVKEEIARRMLDIKGPEEFTNTSCQRLIHGGQILAADNIRLDEAIGPTAERHIQERNVVKILMHYRQITEANKNEEDNMPQNLQCSQTHQRLRSCNILQRNFSECIRNAQMNKSREQRERYNSEERDQEVPQIPKLKDMGKMTERLSNDLLKWANQLERLGDILKEDRPLTVGSSHFNFHQNLVQNNMDGAKYLGHTCEHLVKLTIPLHEAPPRALSSHQPQPNAPNRPT